MSLQLRAVWDDSVDEDNTSTCSSANWDRDDDTITCFGVYENQFDENGEYEGQLLVGEFATLVDAALFVYGKPLQSEDPRLTECGNLDSCPPGTRHWFPAAESWVRIKQGGPLRIIGSEETVSVLAGQIYRVGSSMILDAHEASLSVNDTYVWADVDDDIEPVPLSERPNAR